MSMGGNPAFERLQAGITAMTAGYQEVAEREFQASLRLCKASGDAGRTPMMYLGKLYRKQSRIDDAIAALEAAMPLPAATTELISLFRERGKAAMKAGDADAARNWFDRLLSMGYIDNGLSEPSDTMEDWNQRERRCLIWLAEVKRRFGTIYAWHYERDGAASDCALISNRDYATMHKLAFAQDKSNRRKAKSG